MSARDKYFSYQAYGSAFGGIMTDPQPLTIPTQGMGTLSPSGGYGTSSVDNFGVKDLMTVRSATTTVQGDPRETEVTITIEGIDVLGVLSVGRIVMHLTCRPQPGAYESWISPAGSLIEDLRVNNTLIDLKNHAEVFDRYPTYSELDKAYGSGALNGLILDPNTIDNRSCGGKTLADCTSRAGDVKGTLFPLNASQLPVQYGGLRVKGFGTLYLGEYRITRYQRKLTMLRVELGCNNGGSLSFGGGSGNGHEEPPS